MSIIETKRELAKAVDIFDQFTSELENHKNNLHNYSEDEWRSKLSAMGLEAAKLIQTSRNLDNDSFIELLKRKQKKLIKHAAWKKRNKKRSQQKRKQQLKRNEKWIREIEWKVTISPSNTALRLSQKDSDNVSAESKDEIKLKAKVRELSKKLNKLTELRNLRRKKLESKGHFFAEEGDQFYNLVKELNEQQQQEQNKNETDALNDSENEIKQTFIHKDDVWKNGSIDEIAYNHWCKADQSLDALLTIRKLWDLYILYDSPNSSAEDNILHKVPPTFVAPSPPASWIWASYLL